MVLINCNHQVTPRSRSGHEKVSLLRYNRKTSHKTGYVCFKPHFKNVHRNKRRDWSERAHYISMKHAPLSHTSALLRYDVRSLRYRYERAQFTIQFIKKKKILNVP